MISYLNGEIISKRKNFIVLKVNDVGYKIFLPEKDLEKINLNENFVSNEVKREKTEIFTFFSLGREKLELFGFLTQEGLEFFEILNDISGVGPKTALVLSSFGSLEKLKEAIEKEDENFLKQIKGIGKKRMQKIILEITGKIKEVKKTLIAEREPALEALISLGFSAQRASHALSQIPKEIQETEKKIKEALKFL